MKKYIFILLAAASLTGCTGSGGGDERETMPSLDTAPPHTVTRSTYTGTTVDFVTGATNVPRMGAASGTSAGIGAETGDTADRQGGREALETVPPDGNYRSASETGDTIDGSTFRESAETVTGDTVRSFTETGDTAVRGESVFRDTADTNH